MSEHEHVAMQPTDGGAGRHDGAVEIALTRVRARSAAVQQELELLVDCATGLAAADTPPSSAGTVSALAHALNALQSREADLELACLELEGALGRSAR